MRIALTLLMLLALASLAHSQPPSPSSGEPSQPKQEQPPAIDGKGENDQGDGNAPAGVKKPSAYSAQGVPEDRSDNGNDGSSADWWMVRLTIAMVVVLSLHLAAYVLQWIVLARTLAHSRQSSERQLRAYVHPVETRHINEIADALMFNMDIWGEVAYRDAFLRERRTRFCEVCTYDGLPTGQTAAYEIGNEAT